MDTIRRENVLKLTPQYSCFPFVETKCFSLKSDRKKKTVRTLQQKLTLQIYDQFKVYEVSNPRQKTYQQHKLSIPSRNIYQVTELDVLSHDLYSDIYQITRQLIYFLQQIQYLTYYALKSLIHSLHQDVASSNKTIKEQKEPKKPIRFRPNSCVDYLRRGISLSGRYKLYDQTGKTYAAYCDKSELDTAWTMVMSWTPVNRRLSAFFKISIPLLF